MPHFLPLEGLEEAVEGLAEEAKDLFEEAFQLDYGAFHVVEVVVQDGLERLERHLDQTELTEEGSPTPFDLAARLSPAHSIFLCHLHEIFITCEIRVAILYLLFSPR